MMSLITGAAGTGKTFELRARAREALAAGPVLLLTSAKSSLHVLAEGLSNERVHAHTIAELALQILGEFTLQSEPVEIIDDIDALIIFERAGEPLLALEWAELIDNRIDPEVPGLRAPQRFLEAAFRLIKKLRGAGITPSAFMEFALRGATQFYARPPNFAHPDLLYYTKDAYRNSLDVDATELQRQYRREVDLAKILEKLYTSYITLLGERGCLTASDAIAQATALTAVNPAVISAASERYPRVFVDDVQELSLCDLLFLQALFGEDLGTLTCAGDAQSAISTFKGARPDRLFSLPATRTDLTQQYRTPAAVERAARHLLGADPLRDPAHHASLSLFRASTKRAEASFCAEHVVQLLANGAQPRDVVMLFRSVDNVFLYEQALLARNVDAQIAGNLNLYAVPDVLDALALLWNVHDPFAHDWLLRTLSGRAVNLSDASIVALCERSESAEAPLFALDELEVDETGGRWDRSRDVRLGWNVLRGDRDGALSNVARERVLKLRTNLMRWAQARAHLDVPDLARLIFSEGLARVASAGSARDRSQRRYVERLLNRITEFSQTHPSATLGDFLERAAQRSKSDLESCEEESGDNCVRILQLSNATGREFSHVLLPNVRAGSFPRYYAPDAFLFSPTLGMIAKENVGDARAARTAKFTYYLFAAKTREAFNREERRAFVYAMRRAKESVLVTASERATRGITAPEFLSELQAAGIPGVNDLSDRWRPTNVVWVG